MTRALTTTGRRRRRLSLQEPSRVADPGGGAAQTWVTAAILWAEVRPTSGDESASQHHVQGRISHDIIIRNRPGVEPAMRFLEGNRIYEILAVLDHEGRGRFLKCLCEERQL